MDAASVKESTKFYKTTLASDLIFTKDDTYTIDVEVERFTREFNINHRACIGSLIYLLSTIVHVSFSVNKLEKFPANPGKVKFEGLVHLLRYIWDNKTLGLKYYAYMNDAPLTGLLIRSSIKTENHLMDFSDYSCQDCPDTGRSTGAYIIFLSRWANRPWHTCSRTS